jgi:CHAD domain-containing protein
MTDQSPSIEAELLSALELFLINRDLLAAQLSDARNEKEDAVRQILALRAVVDFLRSIEIPAELLTTFVSVIGDIQKRHEGGNLKPLIAGERHAACAATVDYLRDYADVRLKEALSLVSSLISDLDIKQLDELRKNIRKNRARPEARAFYDSCMKRFKALFEPLSPAMRKTAVLKSIGKIMDSPAANLG